MLPTEFKGSNIVIGENQEGVKPLPALRLDDGRIISCWHLTDEEIEAIVKNKCMYICQNTFNQPLQPILPAAELADLFTYG